MVNEGDPGFRRITIDRGRIVPDKSGGNPQSQIAKEIRYRTVFDNKLDPLIRNEIEQWMTKRAAQIESEAGRNLEGESHWMSEDSARGQLADALSGTRNIPAIFLVEMTKTLVRELEVTQGVKARGFPQYFAELVADARGLSIKKRKELVRSATQGKFHLTAQQRLQI